MGRAPFRIVALGDLTADLIVEVPKLPIRADDFQVADGLQLEPGGSANLLILLARLGAAAAALGTLGADSWGDQVFEILKTEGVEVSGIRREGTTTVAVVLVDAAGRHSFVGSYGKGEPLMLGEREHELMVGADALFASGYSLAEPRLRELTLNTWEVARRRGIPRFFDPGPAFINLRPELKQQILASSDVLLVTEEELRRMSADQTDNLLPPSSTGGPATPKSAEPVGVHTVVVKRGAEGCRVHSLTAEPLDVPGLSVAVRDTTAAGDCFDAAYIWAHLAGRSTDECARLANYAGAAAVGKLGGGRNVPTVEELKQMVLRFGEGNEI